MLKADKQFNRPARRVATWSRGACLLVVGLLMLPGCRQGGNGKPLGATYKANGRPEVWRVPVGSQAAVIGLKPGDLVVAYNGEPVLEQDDVVRAEAAAGTKPVKVTVLRDDVEMTIEAKSGPLGYVPEADRYSASLAAALADILQHYERYWDYDWLAALTGEAFVLAGRAGDARSWGPGADDGELLAEVGRMTGLAFRTAYERAGDSIRPEAAHVLREGLMRGQTLLVRGGWPGHRAYMWGIATRLNPADSTIYGHTVGASGELPLTGPVLAVYEVTAKPAKAPEPDDVLMLALDHALELGLAYADSGWKTGLDAYDLLIQSLDTVPFVLDGSEESKAAFSRLIWSLVAARESAIRFFDEMKEALPDEADDLIDEIMAANRAIVTKLEGITASRLLPSDRESGRKLAVMMNGIQMIENDLLGMYEELLGEL
uniref:PDZ domain-containing protein n=1 Tax=candidate division WOR-3 bacterium TaxID=2052148 RepID=A0A7C4GBA6_UNCW3